MSVDLAHIRQVMAEADCLYSAAQLDAAIARIAGEINRELGECNPLVFCVMNGGLIFAGKLLPLLDFPLELSYLHATRYRGSNQGGELVWKHRPATALYGRRVLIADDILDEGHTLAEVRRWCIEQGATDVRIAAMTVKDHDRCVAGIRADYVGLHLPDRYVFGFGMDYHEQGRNLPGIYALKD